MYLITYRDGDNVGYFTTNALGVNRAVVQLYEHLGETEGISKDLFSAMLMPLTDRESVIVFNKLCPWVKIEKMFTIISEVSLR